MQRWAAIAERNRRKVTENADRVLSDTAYDRYRTPRALRALAAAYVVATVAIPIGWVVGGSIVGIVTVLAATGVFLLLRVAVRSLADLPDEVLDERMRRERDAVYVGAYRVVSTVVFVAANIAFIAVAFPDEATITLDYEQTSAIYWTLVAVILGAPSLVLALRQAEP
jgi:hypothetical protein